MSDRCPSCGFRWQAPSPPYTPRVFIEGMVAMGVIMSPIWGTLLLAELLRKGRENER